MVFHYPVQMTSTDLQKKRPIVLVYVPNGKLNYKYKCLPLLALNFAIKNTAYEVISIYSKYTFFQYCIVCPIRFARYGFWRIGLCLPEGAGV